MAYDSSKDLILIEKQMVSGAGVLTVSLCQYDKGDIKLQIVRKYKDEYTKLGRLNIIEVQFVIDSMIELKGAAAQLKIVEKAASH